MARSRTDDEFEDDDRPQRRNPGRDEAEEEGDERPRRSSNSGRDRDDGGSVKKGLSILGVLSLIQGILALLVSFIPCIGAFAIIGGVLGLLLGGIGLIVAGKSNHGKGLPIAGMIVSVISMIISGIWIVFMAGVSAITPATFTMPTVPSPTTKMENASKPPITADAVKVEAAKLARDYAAGAAKADSTYKGKTLDVSGVITTVDGADKTAIVVQIKSGMLKPVEIRLTPDASKGAGSLKKGSYATFRGTCAGLQDDEFILLEDAEIVK